MATNDVDLEFANMEEAGLRQWVEANPGRDRDLEGFTPLHVAVLFIKSAPLVLWLVKEKGADVNATDKYGHTPLHHASSLEFLTVLLEYGADHTLGDSDGFNPLMSHVMGHRADLIVRLLQDPRIRASVNVRNATGTTALHIACRRVDQPEGPAMVQLLLQAGANLTLTNARGQTPMDRLQEHHPTHTSILALLEQILDAEKASSLVKARRLVMAATRTTHPSYLQGRVARGLPLPVVALAPAMGGLNNDELRTMLARLVGIDGGRKDAAGRVSGGAGAIHALVGPVAA